MLLRPFAAHEIEAYRTLRLTGIRERPPAFGAVYEDEAALTPEDLVRRSQVDQDRWTLGAFVDERPLGMVRFTRFAAANQRHKAFLTGMYVAPAARRTGVGRALLRETLARAQRIPGLRRVNLSVVVGNEGALALYRSFGFVIFGTEPEYFCEDAVYYAEHLLTLRLNELPDAPAIGW